MKEANEQVHLKGDRPEAAMLGWLSPPPLRRGRVWTRHANGSQEGLAAGNSETSGDWFNRAARWTHNPLPALKISAP